MNRLNKSPQAIADFLKLPIDLVIKTVGKDRFNEKDKKTAHYLEITGILGLMGINLCSEVIENCAHLMIHKLK